MSDLIDRIYARGAIVQHFKGGRYRILEDNAQWTGSPPTRMVVYQSLENGQVWVRPHAEFWDDVPMTTPRFVQVDPAT